MKIRKASRPSEKAKRMTLPTTGMRWSSMSTSAAPIAYRARCCHSGTGCGIVRSCVWLRPDAQAGDAYQQQTDAAAKRSALQPLRRVEANLGQKVMMPEEKIVAVGLLTRHDLTVLGPTFDRVWPVEEAPSFSE